MQFAEGGEVRDVMRSEYRKLTEEELGKIREVKDMGAIFHDYLDGLGESREASIAKTKIEEAVMWATKALSGVLLVCFMVGVAHGQAQPLAGAPGCFLVRECVQVVDPDGTRRLECHLVPVCE